MKIRDPEGLDLGKNELKQAVVEKLASAPSAPLEGQLYYDTVTHKLMVRGASTWTEPGGGIASVNGKTGVVVLTQDDVGDGSTYKRYSQTDKTKLAGIEAGADVTDAANVAAAGAFVKSVDDLDDITDGTTYKKYSATEKTKLAGVEAGADVTDAANVAAAGAVMAANIGTTVQAYDAFLDQIAALTDPGGDRILFWDDSAGQFTWLTVGSNLTVVGTTISASGGGGGGGSLWTDNGDGTISYIAGNVGIGTLTPTEKLQVIGNIEVSDDPDAPTKGYRLRTSGGNLDFDASGVDLFLSCFADPGYAGTQYTYLRLEGDAQMAHAVGMWRFGSGPYAGDGITIDGNTGDVDMSGDITVDGIALVGGVDVTYSLAQKADLASTQTLSNKTISGASNTLTNISADSTVDGTTNKVYTATEKTKLAGIATGADVTAAANVSTAGGLITVNHGATAGTTRPSVSGPVMWIGSVEPTNASNGDVWVDTA